MGKLMEGRGCSVKFALQIPPCGSGLRNLQSSRVTRSCSLPGVERETPLQMKNMPCL